MNLSGDINLLVSILNTYLRDKYDSIKMLCYDEDIIEDELMTLLEKNNYYYDDICNQVRKK